MGHEVKLINPNYFNFTHLQKEHQLDSDIDKEDLLIPSYSKFEIYLIKGLHKLKKSIGRDLRLWRIKQAVCQFRPDLIWNHGANVRANNLLLTGYKPQVTSIYGSEIKLSEKKILKGIFCKSEYVLVSTVEMADRIKKMFPEYRDKVRLLPWGDRITNSIDKIRGVDKKELREKYGYKTNDKILVDIRAARDLRSGGSELIKSISILKEEIKNIRLIIIKGYSGNDAVVQHFETIIEKQKLENYIKIIKDSVSNHILVEILSMTDVFLSLLPADQFGASIIKAAITENDLVLSDLKVYRDYFNNNAHYLDQITPETIAKSIRSVFSDAENIKRMKRENNKKITIKEFDWNTNTKMMFDFFDTLINRSHGEIQ